jgi:hypothetical protein
VITAGTKIKDLQTSKLSSDYLAAMERDVRARRRSRVRSFVHSEITLPAANGEETGALTRNTMGWLTNIMSTEAGGS